MADCLATRRLHFHSPQPRGRQVRASSLETAIAPPPATISTFNSDLGTASEASNVSTSPLASQLVQIVPPTHALTARMTADPICSRPWLPVSLTHSIYGALIKFRDRGCAREPSGGLSRWSGHLRRRLGGGPKPRGGTAPFQVDFLEAICAAATRAVNHGDRGVGPSPRADCQLTVVIAMT